MALSWKLLLILKCVVLLALETLGEEFYFDFDNANDCSHYYSGPQKMGDDDKAYITAHPRDSNFGGPTECILKFEAPEREKGLRFFTKHFSIFDCGVTLEIFDQNRFIKDPKFVLDCHTPTSQIYVIDGGEMTLRLAKASSVAYNYRFDMQVTTKNSPKREYPDEIYRPGTQRRTITEGAMIGVSISCIVGGGILIAIIVFFVCRRRRQNRRDSNRHDSKFQSEI